MRNSQYYYKAHDAARNNLADLERSSVCGCFACITIFSPKSISDCTHRAALCPFCGIDAVIAEASGYPITEEFLLRVHYQWFCHTVNFDSGEVKENWLYDKNTRVGKLLIKMLAEEDINDNQ